MSFTVIDRNEGELKFTFNGDSGKVTIRPDRYEVAWGGNYYSSFQGHSYVVNKPDNLKELTTALTRLGYPVVWSAIPVGNINDIQHGYEVTDKTTFL